VTANATGIATSGAVSTAAIAAIAENGASAGAIATRARARERKNR